MYLWNRNTIDKNIKLLKKIITMKKSTYDLNKIVFSLSSYKKVNEKLGDISDECYQQHFLNCPLVDDILDMDRSSIMQRKDANEYLTIYDVAYFLHSFNIDFYNSFIKMVKDGLISLDKKDCNTNGEIFVDTINNVSFINIESTFIKSEAGVLINQFARAYQLEHNELGYSPESLIFEDAFPKYLEYSMLDFYQTKSKEESIEDMRSENELSYIMVRNITEDKANRRVKEKEKYTKNILSNTLASCMLLNNDIDINFDSIDEFIRKNHIGTKSKELLSIANKNMEGIRHIIR